MTTKGRQPWIIGALALALTGCAGAVSPLQSAGAGAVGDGSWMSPATNGRNLLYVSDEAANAVDVFTFPFGTPVGVLRQSHDPVGICSDKTGYVWVVNAPNHVLKYAHGAQRPGATMEDAHALRLPPRRSSSYFVDARARIPERAKLRKGSHTTAFGGAMQ